MADTIYDMYRDYIKPASGDIGIEIEMEGLNLPAAPNGWREAVDGSIGHGLEYVMTKPVPFDKVESSLTTLQEYFARCGATLNPSDRCGVHIHVNVQKMTFKQVINYACLYLIMEEPLIRWCGEDRIGNLFCLDAGSADGLIERLAHAVPQGTFRYSFSRDAFRYASVNFDAIQKYGSLEFRAMKTHAQFVRPITTWVNTLWRIKEQSLLFPDVVSAVNDFSVSNPISFTRRVLGDLYREFECEGIQQMLLDGVRRVQDVAYAEQQKPVAQVKPVKKAEADRIWIDPFQRDERPVAPNEPERQTFPTHTAYEIAWFRWALQQDRNARQFVWWGPREWENARRMVAEADAANQEEQGDRPPAEPVRDRAGRFAAREARIRDLVIADEEVGVIQGDYNRIIERFRNAAAEAPRANPPRARRSRRLEVDGE
jgi:hypothetical protein